MSAPDAEQLDRILGSLRAAVEARVQRRPAVAPPLHVAIPVTPGPTSPPSSAAGTEPDVEANKGTVDHLPMPYRRGLLSRLLSSIGLGD